MKDTVVSLLAFPFLHLIGQCQSAVMNRIRVGTSAKLKDGWMEQRRTSSNLSPKTASQGLRFQVIQKNVTLVDGREEIATGRRAVRWGKIPAFGASFSVRCRGIQLGRRDKPQGTETLRLCGAFQRCVS